MDGVPNSLEPIPESENGNWVKRDGDNGIKSITEEMQPEAGGIHPIERLG